MREVRHKSQLFLRRAVEAHVKAFPAVLFLSGVTSTIAGAVTRSCDQDASSQLAHAWCGPPLQALSSAHEHCAGCVMLVAGVALVAASLVVTFWKRPAAALAFTKART